MMLGTGLPGLAQYEQERRAAQPLAEFSTATPLDGPGCNAMPDVKDFFARRVPVGAARVPPIASDGHHQRLKPARPLAKRPGWGARDFQAFNYVRDSAMVSHLTGPAGVPLRAEAVRATPSTRLKHIVRPGFLERGQQSVALTNALLQRDEHARLAAQHAASELTRRKLRRRTDDNHRQRELSEPLPKLVAERAAKRKTGERIGAYRAANDQGRAAVMDELDRFDRLRGTLGTAPDAKL